MAFLTRRPFESGGHAVEGPPIQGRFIPHSIDRERFRPQTHTRAAEKSAPRAGKDFAGRCRLPRSKKTTVHRRKLKETQNGSPCTLLHLSPARRSSKSNFPGSSVNRSYAALPSPSPSADLQRSASVRRLRRSLPLQRRHHRPRQSLRQHLT